MAIAFDAFSSAATAANGTSLTWSHTCAGGTDNVLIVGGENRTGVLPSSVTYNGDTVTALQDLGVGSFQGINQWYRIAPDSGSNNIVVTQAGSSALSYGAISLTGCNTSPIGNINTASGTGGSNPSITVGTGNWAISMGTDNNSPNDGQTATSPQTQRYTRYTTGGSAAHTVGATNDTDNTVSFGSSFGTCYGAAVEILAPVSGPANVKTWDGLAIASVKVVNGLAIGSTKTINGLN